MKEIKFEVELINALGLPFLTVTVLASTPKGAMYNALDSHPKAWGAKVKVAAPAANISFR